MPLGDETLTALFEANDYTFDFSTTLGTTPSSITVPYLTTVELPILFEEGYTFNGWEIDRVLVTGSLVMPISGASLTAKFTPNDYTITFNQTLGTLQSPLTQAYTSSITLPVLEEPGYTFLGWLNSDDILVDYQTMPLGDETLTALFEANDYTIRFESITQLETELITASYLSLISLPSLALEGHSFTGWEGKDTLITNGSLTVPLNGITLTAIFEINQYTLSFATYNDEYFKPVDLDFMDPLTLPLPIKEGHTFKGWFEGSTFFRSTSMPSRDLLLKAQWEINSYQVTLKDGDEVIDQYEVNYGASLNLPTPQKNGYQFDQWMIDNEPFNLDRMPANDLVINAIYSLDLITVSYVIDGIKTEISVAYGETYSPSVPNKKGYIFNTWTVNDEPVESMTIEESGIEFIAEFYPAESIQRITTPLGTLELVLKTDELVQGLNTLNLPGGYRFVGFFTRPFGSGDSLNEELIIEDASNTIFYPYYLGNNTASTDLSTLLSLEGRAIPTKVQEPKITTPWLEIFGFTLTVIVMTSLYVTTKDKKHA